MKPQAVDEDDRCSSHHAPPFGRSPNRRVLHACRWLSRLDAGFVNGTHPGSAIPAGEQPTWVRFSCKRLFRDGNDRAPPSVLRRARRARASARRSAAAVGPLRNPDALRAALPGLQLPAPARRAPRETRRRLPSRASPRRRRRSPSSGGPTSGSPAAAGRTPRSSVRPSFAIRIPFARSIDLRASSASSSELAWSFTSANSAWRACAAISAGITSCSRNGFAR